MRRPQWGPTHQKENYRQYNCLLFLNESVWGESYLHPFLSMALYLGRGPACSVGIATELLAELSVIKSRFGRVFPPVHTSHGAHPAYCRLGTGSFPGAKYDQGVLLTTHPLLVPRSWNSRAIPLPTLWAKPGLYRDHFTF